MLELAMKHGDDWKTIADEMKLKNKKEAVLEFLRIPEINLRADSKFLQDYNFEPLVKANQLKEVEPYNQADLLFLQCELLQEFAHAKEKIKPKDQSEENMRKRLAKEKRKLA